MPLLCYFYYSCSFSPIHPIRLFVLFVHAFALLPYITLLTRLAFSILIPTPYNFWPFLPSLELTVSSPPLSLTQPYFLHTALPRFRPGFCNYQPVVDPRPRSPVGQESADEYSSPQWPPAPSSDSIHTDDSSPVYNYESLADFPVDFSLDYGDVVSENTHPLYEHIKDPRNTERDFASDSICNFDSLYGSESDLQTGAHTESDTPVSGTAEGPGCITPYKNIDVMMTFSNNISAMNSFHSGKRAHAHPDHTANKARTSKELPPLPTCYLYHPKNCPLHKGAPPRLSPIGALSPPQRSGAPPLGATGSSLSSPLFPRSHTLPALAAPLYYPNLYPPVPPTAPPLPPKLYQAPLQSRVASKISLSAYI